MALNINSPLYKLLNLGAAVQQRIPQSIQDPIRRRVEETKTLWFRNPIKPYTPNEMELARKAYPIAFTPRNQEEKDKRLEQISSLAFLGITGLKTPSGKTTFGAGHNFKEASDYITSKIAREPEKAPLTQKIKNIIPVLKSNLVDSFSPIETTINQAERIGKYRLLPTKDPRLLRNRVFGSGDIGVQAIKRDLLPTLKNVGANNLDEFDRYLAARQAIDVSGRGVETGLDMGKAKTYVDTLSPRYEQAATEVTKFTQKVLGYVREGGLISDEVYGNLLQRYPRYVPLNRVFDEIDRMATGLPSSKAVGSLAKQTVVQTLKGSERDIASPLSSIFDKTINAVKQVETNRTAKAIVALRSLPQFADDIKPATSASKHTISVFENGAKTLYEVPEGFEAAAKNLNKVQTNVLINAVAIPTRIARLGITGLNLPFTLTNFVRDQLFTTLTSRNTAKTSIANPYNWFKSYADTVGGTGLYDDFLAQGGGWSTYFKVGQRERIGTLKEALTPARTKVAKTIVTPTKWLATIEDAISRFGEQPTRVQQYGGTLEALGAKGAKVEPLAPPTRAGLLAVKAGRENSTDFAKKGAYGDVLNSVFIYLNAGIQGSRTALRALKTNPVGTSLKLTATLFTPMAAATLWNTATPERKAAYEDISEWEKSNSIIILPPNPTKDKNGNWQGALKVPLPFNFAALTIPIRKGLEYQANIDAPNIKDALATFLGFASPVDIQTDKLAASLASRLTPTATLPFLEAATNTKFFTGSPIVPRFMENLPPGLQTRSDTSGFVEKIGKLVNYSPAKLQNFVQAYSGGTGLQLLNVIDQALAKAGVIESADIGGRSLLEEIQRRFTKASGGRKAELEYQNLKGYKEAAAVKSQKEKQAAEEIYSQLQSLPREEWRAKLSFLKKDGILNERIYQRVVELDKAEQSGLEGADKSVKSLPVTERANWILDQLNTKDPSEHRSYLSDLKRKGILSEAVFIELESSGYTLPEPGQATTQTPQPNPDQSGLDYILRLLGVGL